MDGEESRLVFLDHPHGAIKLENLLNTYKYLHIYNIYNIYIIYGYSPQPRRHPRGDGRG